MKKIAILGSTGSIGKQALEVVRKNPHLFKITALSCNKDWKTLSEQIKEFHPQMVAINDEKMAALLRKEMNIEVLSELAGIIDIAKHADCHILLNSIVGSIGITPTIAAIKSGKNIAIANKETLVTAGELVMDLVKKYNTSILPVDSEHSAIFQCARGFKKEDIKRLILTCSGGAFRNKKKEELNNVTVNDALNHPNWNMGNKITIDSATLINKGLEVIEAKILFAMDYNQIDVVIHPESIIHSLIELNNNSTLAQLSYPDMRLPIEYALSYPDVLTNSLKPINLSKIGQLTFFEPDLVRFPALHYAYQAGKTGGSMPCVLNAANEAAVQAFLMGKIKFNTITAIIKKKMDEHTVAAHPTLEELLFMDEKIKNEVNSEINCGTQW